MAIFHMSIKVGGRSAGRSACASAAYRAGERIRSEEMQRTFDYTKRGGVVHSEILLPDNAPPEYADRETLWNAVESKETAKNAQLFREFEISLPRELDRAEQIDLVREWARAELVERGMCVDIAIHDRGDGNPHAHIMTTTRALDELGQWTAKERKQYKLNENGERVPVIDKKTGEQKREAKTGRRVWERETVSANDWNDRARAEEWRASWARACNERLPDADHIDHRSYERQGVERVPGVHIGYNAERREMNEEAARINAEARRLNFEKRSAADLAETQKTLDALGQRVKAIEKTKEEKQMSIIGKITGASDKQPRMVEGQKWDKRPEPYSDEEPEEKHLMDDYVYRAPAVEETNWLGETEEEEEERKEKEKEKEEQEKREKEERRQYDGGRDSVTDRLAAVMTAASGIEHRHADAVQTAKETVAKKEGFDAPTLLDAFETLKKYADAGDKDLQAFLEKYADPFPPEFRKGFTPTDDRPRGYSQMTRIEKIEAICRHWDAREAELRRAERAAKANTRTHTRGRDGGGRGAR